MSACFKRGQREDSKESLGEGGSSDEEGAESG